MAYLPIVSDSFGKFRSALRRSICVQSAGIPRHETGRTTPCNIDVDLVLVLAGFALRTSKAITEDRF
ncbi:MAG: hypothetical protein AAFX07_00495 [Pseudomonadota bacterium]